LKFKQFLFIIIFLEKANWKDLSNEAILECSVNRKIDFSNLIKKIFNKSSVIEPSVLESNFKLLILKFSSFSK